MSKLQPASARRWWETGQSLTLVVIATMIPLLRPAMPPLVDLPGHMGRYRVVLADQPALDSWYSFQWHLVGNLGVDLLVLAPLLVLELGVKLVILMIPPLIALRS